MKIGLAALAIASVLCVVWFGFPREPAPSPSPVPPRREAAGRAASPELELITRPVATGASTDLREGRYVLNGRVTLEGRPVPASVELRRAPIGVHPWNPPIDAVLSSPASREPPIARVSAESDGRFRIRGLAPGSYWIDAFTAEAKADRWIRIASGIRPQLVFLKLVPTDGGITLRGRAVFADGSSFVGMVFSSEADLVRTDAEGRFRLAGLHAGEAKIAFLDPGVFRADLRINVPHEGELLVRVDKNLRSVAGRVLGASDDTPIAGARVSVSGWAGGHTARTDESGRFSLLVPIEFARLTVDADGFVRAVADVRSATEVEIRLVKPGTVTGRVLDTSGTIRPGTPVLFSHTIPGHGVERRRTVSDEEGRFEFRDAPPGTASICALGAGLASEALRDLTGWVNPLVIEVPVNGTAERDIIVVDTGRVTGLVVDENGDPAGGVAIEALPVIFECREYGLATTFSSPTGTFEFDQLIPGCRYSFAAVSNLGIASRAGPVSVDSGETRKIEIRLVGPRWIDLTARDAVTGGPVAGAGVTVWQDEGIAHFLTDRKGHARLGPLLPADARIRLDHGGYLRPAQSPVVRADGPDEIEIELQPGLLVSGFALEIGGTPLARGSVSLSEAASSNPPKRNSCSARVGSDGAFRVGPVPAGTYELKVFDPRGERKRLSVRAGDKGLMILLDPAPEKQPDPVLPDLGEVVVRFRGPDGRPPVGGVVRILRIGNGGWTEAGETGSGFARFTIREPGGQVRITVVGACASDGTPLGDSLVGPVDLKQGEIAVDLAAGGEITGRIVGPDGRGLRGLSLHVRRTVPGGASHYPSQAGGRTGPDGSFALKGVGEGSHEIYLSTPPEFVMPGGFEARAGDHLEIRLRRAAVLRILFVDGSGAPASDVQIVARSRTDPPRFVNGYSFAAGVVTIRQLDPTLRYDLRAKGPGGLAALVEGLDPSAGEVSVRLHPGGSIRGRFRVPEGADNFEVWAALDGICTYGKVEANGNFEIDGLSPGRWEIAVATNSADGVSWRGRAEAEPGDEMEIALVPRK